MLSNSSKPFKRDHFFKLKQRLEEPRLFIQVVTGPRQVGKTTLVQQVAANIKTPVIYVSADEPTLRGRDWLAQQWDAARLAARKQSDGA